MKEETSEKIEGVKIRDRIGKNLLNVGVFAMEVLVLVLLGPWAFKFFLPMLTGWLIAQIANPLVRFLEKHLHIVRSHSSFGIIAGVILLIVLGCYYLVSWLFGEAGVLLERIPDYYHSLVQMLNTASLNLEHLAGRLSPEAGQKINEVTTLLTSNLGNLVGSLGGVTVGAAGTAAGKIPALLVSFLFVLLFAYFFIAQRERMHALAEKVIPEDTRRQISMVWKKLKYAVGGYFRAQFKIMFIVFVLLAIGFLILRVDYALLLGVLIAFLDFLPMLGTGTVLIPWAVCCALGGKLPMAAGILILYAVTQVTRQLIQPKIVGDSIGIDPMTTLVFLFVGYRIGGIIGMIVAVPVGLILIQLYEAGAFDHVIESCRELAADIHTLRRGE